MVVLGGRKEARECTAAKKEVHIGLGHGDSLIGITEGFVGLCRLTQFRGCTETMCILQRQLVPSLPAAAEFPLNTCGTRVEVLQRNLSLVRGPFCVSILACLKLPLREMPPRLRHGLAQSNNT